MRTRSAYPDRTNNPRKVNSRRWRRETRRRYPPPRRWMKADSHLPVDYTSFRLLPLSCRATEPFQRSSWFRKGGDPYRNRIAESLN